MLDSLDEVIKKFFESSQPNVLVDSYMKTSAYEGKLKFKYFYFYFYYFIFYYFLFCFEFFFFFKKNRKYF